MPRDPRIVDALRSAGHMDSSGVFSVDRQGALEKMRQFQLADPRDYVLNLVSGAVALGAQAIDFRLDGRRCKVVMTGMVLPPDFLEQPLSFLFVDPERMELEGYRELAIGLCAAQFLQPSRVLIQSGGRGCQLRDLQTQPMARVDSGSDTVVEITSRTGLRQLLGSDVQVQMLVLQDKAGACPVPLTVNGERLRPAEPARPFLLASDDVDLWLGEHPGRVQFIKHGVRVCERMLTLKTPIVSGRVVADDLLKNVSGSDVVEDDRYMHLLGELDRTCDRWLVLACNEYLGAPPRLQAKVRLQLLQSISIHEGEELPAGLQDVPVFETLDGQYRSVRDLQRYLETHKKLRHVSGDLPLRADVSKFILRLREPWALPALDRAFGRSAVPVKNPSTSPLPLPEGSYLLTWPFQERGYSGYLGMLRDPDAYARVTCWRRGQLVAEKTWGANGVPYRLALQHNRSEWQDQELQEVAEEALEDACCWLARTIRPPHPEAPAVQRALLGWLSAHPQVRPPAIIQEYPLFETADGKLATCLDLKADVEAFGAAFHAVGAATGQQTDGRHIVVDPNAVLVLGQIFPKVVDYRTVLSQQRKAVAPIKAVVVPPLCPISIERGGLKITVGVNAERSGSLRRWDTTLRFGGQVRSVALEFGPLDASIETPELTEEQFDTVVRALREEIGRLAEQASDAIMTARDWQQDRLREFLLRYLTWRGEVPEALLDTPIFIGLGRSGVSIRQLRAGGTVRYVSTDVGPLEVSRPVLVCTRAAADIVSRVVRRPPENWEHGLSERLLYQAYGLRPEANIHVSERCFHSEAASPLRVGFLPLSAAFDGQSQVRVLWQGRLLDTISVPTLVPVDVVLADDGLTPGPTYESVRRDADLERVLATIPDILVTGIDALCGRTLEGPVRDTLLRWALAQCEGRESILLAAASSRLGRLARLPLLTSLAGKPAALRDVASQERCLYSLEGEDASPVEGELVVTLSPLHHEWMATVFDMQSVAVEAPQELSAHPLLRSVQQCLAAYPPSRPLARRLCLGSGNGKLLEQEASGVIVINQDHPMLRQPTAVAMIAASAWTLFSAGTLQDELDFLLHVANWIA